MSTEAISRRPAWRSVRQWRSSRRLVGVSAFVLLLASLHIPGRPPTLCILRATTGIPCPFCGGTTAGADLGHGDVPAALRASPLAVIGAILFVLSPLIRRSKAGTWWFARPARFRQVVATTAIIASLTISEVWQLARFGLI